MRRRRTWSTKAPAGPDPDNVNFHGQTTFLWQGYPAFRSPYEGTNSLPGGGQGRETWDATLYAGVRLWQGAELWVNPEIDQGFGLAEHAWALLDFRAPRPTRLGRGLPLRAIARAHFIRQTIDLGGESAKVDADINQFAGSQTANRLVLRSANSRSLDIFDTNKYAQ